MSVDLNRIREFRRLRGLTLQQVADMANTSKAQVDKLERGERRLTVDWMVRLSRALTCQPADLMGAPEGFSKNNQIGYKNGNFIPVYGCDGIEIDRIQSPYFLQHVKDAYALYITDDTMAPMYRPRQTLFINPYKLPVPGCGVAVRKEDGYSVREYVREKAGSVVLRHYQPTLKEMSVARDMFDALHTVVGLIEP